MQTEAFSPSAHSDNDLYLAAYRSAVERARYSDFDVHIIRNADGSYWWADEGDYACDTSAFADDIVHTVAGRQTGLY
jgi:hypothetical protein